MLPDAKPYADYSCNSFNIQQCDRYILHYWTTLFFFLPNSQTTFVNRPALGVSPPGDWTELLNGQLLSVILIYFSINYPFNRLLHMKKITWVLHYFRHSFIFFKISSFMIILDFSYTVSFAVSFTKTHQA